MARAARGSSRSKKTVKVNFKDIETRTRVNKEGDYPLKCLEATIGKSGNNNDQIEFTFEVSKGEFKGAKAWFYCPLTENSLWKLHALMTAMGMEVPEDEMEIDVSEFTDMEIVGVFTPDTYNGKRTFKMTDFCSIDDYKGGDDDKEEKSSKKDKKGGKDKSDKKDKSEKKPNYSKMDEDELRELYVERDLGTKKEAKKLDEDELIEALEDADAAASKSSSKKGDKKEDKKSGKKKAKKVAEDDVEDMDEDELQALVDEHDLDVELDDIKKLPKKVSAVIKALKAADLLED